MRRHDHRGNLVGAVLAVAALFAFDVSGAKAQLPPTVRLVATHMLVVAAAGLVATWCTRLVLARWTARRDAAQAVAVQESYRLGWSAATDAQEPPTLRLVGTPRRP